MANTMVIRDAHVLSVTNHREDFGRMPLITAAPIASGLQSQLNQEGVSSRLVGGILLGSTIPVHPSYLHARETSRLVEVFCSGSQDVMAAILEDLGFKPVGADNSFSISYSQGGTVRTIATLEGQKILGGSGAFPDITLAVAHVPTLYYHTVNGPDGLQLAVSTLSDLPTPGQSVGHKIVRASLRDIQDVTQIALVGKLEDLLRDGGAAVIEDAAEEKVGNNKWLKEFRRKVGKIIEGIRTHVTGNEPLAEENVDTLYQVNTSATAIVKGLK